jgi:peptidoglycan/xylan/chitin deacetylase (PgdA/CDA1 family)
MTTNSNFLLRFLLPHLGAQFSSSGKGRLLVLMYHRVLEKPDAYYPNDVDAESFERQLAIFSQYFNVLSVAEAVECISQGTLPPRSVCLTFDDGYMDNYSVALPLLKKYGMKGTFFVASGFLNGGIMWNDRVAEIIRYSKLSQLTLDECNIQNASMQTEDEKVKLVKDIISKIKYLPMDERNKAVTIIEDIAGKLPVLEMMMRDEHVLALHNEGMEIGGHTENHPILANLQPQDMRQEIARNKETLERIIDASLKTFAYPNGKPGRDYSGESIDIVSELGYRSAVSTAWGFCDAKTDRFQLPRVSFMNTSLMDLCLRMFRAYRERRPELVTHANAMSL